MRQDNNIRFATSYKTEEYGFFVVIEEDNLLDWLRHVDLKKSTGLWNKSRESDLELIFSDYGILPYNKEMLEKRSHLLRDSLKLEEDVIEKILVVHGNKGQSVLQECERTFCANKDLPAVMHLSLPPK
ncbi:hypothetical protein FQA39_LY09805 [Lamprigera yunnana]|nr:hypothetical protein FQA39_LY09805 [Lamprigera yunnana]